MMLVCGSLQVVNDAGVWLSPDYVLRFDLLYSS